MFFLLVQQQYHQGNNVHNIVLILWFVTAKLLFVHFCYNDVTNSTVPFEQET